MIALKKGDEPEILRSNGNSWLKKLEDKIAAGETPSESDKARYRHPEIKDALKVETHGKCAYCESRLLHIAFGDVEHISPKSLKLADTFRWDNLTLACDVCNTYKKDAANIVDPYQDNPAEFFKFLGPMIYANPSQIKGIITAKQLKLNRPELVASRLRRLDAIASLIFIISSTTNQSDRAVLIDDLFNNEAADESEYAAFVRSFINVIDEHFLEPLG